MCLLQTDLKQARTLFDVRFWGCIASVKAAQQYIRPGGSITMTSGTIALKPIKDWAVATGDDPTLPLSMFQPEAHGSNS